MIISKDLITRVVKNTFLVKGDSCIGVLGSDYALAQVAEMWNRLAGEMQLISTHIIIEKGTKDSISSEQFNMFKEGIAKMLEFMDNAHKEYYKIK